MEFDTSHAEKANSLRRGTLMELLDIRFEVDGSGRLVATMPVDERTHQPMGLLHGGATAALAESLGSTGSWMLLDPDRSAVVGLEVSANHLRGVLDGRVTAVGELLHQGKKTHVWEIRVRDEAGRLCAVCRLTNMIIDKRK